MSNIGQDTPRLPASGTHDGFVHVRGANENNLRNVEVRVPRDAIVAFTGVSGSGKSSLAFGTIFAEAQRRFLESVAPYARRLIAQGHTPDVEFISGLPPAVALQQRRGTASSRSTVGTLTTLSNSVRMLYSRAGDYPQGAKRLESDSFSPNTVVGACSQCHGLGIVHTVTEESLVPDPSLSIREGAIAAWPGAWQGKSLRDITTQLGYDVDVPFKEMPKKDRDWLLFTDEHPVVQVTPERDRVAKPYKGRFWSAKSSVLHTVAESKSQMMRAKALQFMHSGPCPTCSGTGFRPEALDVTVAGLNIAAFNGTALDSLAEVLRPLSVIERDGQPASEVSASIAADLLERIEVLTGLGLGYLSLKRGTPTLSPGEMQRLRIATQLRSGLFGVIYVLDEPSAGLHPADAQPLLVVLEALKAAGNSVFVVEHNMDVVASADWIVDVGPRAGSGGGQVLYSGPVAGLQEVSASVTRKFLGHPHTIEGIREPREATGWLELDGVHLHNLVDLDAKFPLGVFSVVTGVSGSGKSTLVSQALAQTLRGETLDQPAAGADSNGQETDTETNQAVIGAVRGAGGIDRVVAMDQKPIGRTPRSNLATYTGLFDAVRKAFAQTELAMERGYGASRFSFNVAGGRCENCLGEGYLEIELLFLPGSYGVCPVCHGSRYNPETLEVTYEGKNIAQVLELSVDEAAKFLVGIPAAARSLITLREVGLGYLALGQPAPELSGGEAQRIKLATELQRARRGHTLYLLDEPTTGLHPADVQLLLGQLNRLVDASNTVIVVEHHMDVVAAADWVIDLGPAGGDAGGRIVATGTPERIAADPDSRTAPYLAERLGLEPLVT